LAPATGFENNVSATPIECSQAPASASTSSLECPCSLRRRAPGQILITDEKGVPVPLNSAGFSLFSGKCFFVRVRPQPADDLGRVDHVALEGEVFRIVTQPLPGANQEYKGTIKVRLIWPVAARAELTVILSNESWEPFSFTVPVVVRPSFRKQLTWVVGIVAVPLVTLLLKALIVGGTELTVLVEKAQDGNFWTRAAACVIGLVGLLRFFSWVPMPHLGRDE